MTERKSKLAGSQAGTILVMVIFMSVLLAGSATYLLARTRSELFNQNYRKTEQTAMHYAISGMTIAMVTVNSGRWNSGPSGDMNEWLWPLDPIEDGNPGRYIVDDGTYSVRVKNLGDMWYELTSVGECDSGLVGTISRTVVLRVRDRDFFSRWALYLEHGDGIVDDTNNWYGNVHTNTCLRMRNRILGQGAHFYDEVTSCNPPQDYPVWEVGGCAEAVFEEPPIWNAEEIELPPTTAFATLRATAEEGDGEWHTIGDNAAKIWVGENGISIIPLGNFKDIDIDFEKDWSWSKGYHQEVTITIRDNDDWEEHDETFDVPHNGVVFSEREIEGVQGEIYDRFTLACGTGYVKIAGDIMYVDDHDRNPYKYDYRDPEDPDNFEYNNKYRGDACFAIMAKKDILLSNHDDRHREGHHQSKTDDEKDLVMHGVFAAGIGDPPADGAVRWWNWGEGDYNTVKRDLRVYGAMIADGVGPIGGMTVGHFKGWTSGGVPVGGYNNSVFKYDHGLRSNPPPHFMEITLPLYVGWEFRRRG